MNTLCSFCQKTPSVAVCGQCKSIGYCSKDCQHSHWNIGHRLICDVVVSKRPVFSTPSSSSDPMWIPSVNYMKNVPPIPKDILSNLKSDYEITHVKRMREIKWLETIAKDIFTGALAMKGVDERDIATLLSVKEKLYPIWENFLKTGTFDEGALERETEVFRIMLETVINPADSNPIENLQVRQLEQKLSKFANIMVHDIETKYKCFYKDGDEDETVDKASLLELFITEDSYEPTFIGGGITIDDLQDTKEALEDMLKRGVSPKDTQYRTLWAEYQELLKLFNQKRDDALEVADNRQRRNQEKSWKEMINLLCNSAKDNTGYVIKTLYNKTLTLLFYGQGVDPFAKKDDLQMVPGLTARKRWMGVLLTTATIASAYWGIKNIQSAFSDNVASEMSNVVKAASEVIVREADTIKIVSVMQRNVTALQNELFDLRNVTDQVLAADRILLNTTMIESGAFLINPDVQSALELVDGPMSYAREISVFFGGLHDSLRDRYLKVYESPKEFSKIANDLLNRFKSISEQAEAGVPLKDMEKDIRDIYIDMKHSHDVINPGHVEFVRYIREKLSIFLAQNAATETTMNSLRRDLEQKNAESVVKFAATGVAAFQKARKTGSLYEAEVDSTKIITNLANTLFNEKQSLISGITQTLMDPFIRNEIQQRLFFGDNFTGQLLSASFSTFYGILLVGGGFRTLELMFAGTAWFMGKVTDAMTWLCKRFSSIDIPDNLDTVLRFHVDGIATTNGLGSTVGFLIASIIGTVTRNVEVATGGASVFFKTLADEGLSFTAYSTLVGFMALASEALVPIFISNPTVLSLYDSGVAPLLTWGAGMIIVLYHTKIWQKIGLTPFVQYARYRQSLPKQWYMGGMGEKEFNLRQKFGWGFSLYILSSFMYNEFSLRLYGIATGDVSKHIGQ